MSKLYTEDQFLRIFGGIIATALKEMEKLEPVQIVRCKDCKHNCYCCRLSRRTSEDYCSHAERRTDETD